MIQYDTNDRLIAATERFNGKNVGFYIFLRNIWYIFHVIIEIFLLINFTVLIVSFVKSNVLVRRLMTYQIPLGALSREIIIFHTSLGSRNF